LQVWRDGPSAARSPRICTLRNAADPVDQLPADQIAANACLIAAAPNMYEALKTLLFNCRHGNGLEAQYQALDRAESALAKAEGRS
jgi:hypothetical protein